MPRQPAKKTTAKKTTVKKAATEKATATKSKATVRKALKTSIIAYVDVGFGNTLYLRGEGSGLSWEKGVAMKNVSATEWAFNTTKATGAITFKFLINDQIWAEGNDLQTTAGSKSISSPQFNW